MSDLGQQLEAAAVTAADAPAGVDVVLLADALRIAALSVAPAPVAAQPVAWMVHVPNDEIEWIENNIAGRGYLRDFMAGNAEIATPDQVVAVPLYTSPPVQEGPKGVDAKFADLLSAIINNFDLNSGWEQMPEAKALMEYFKQCTARSIPAAPCQCKPDETTGWTDDDIMVPRCNVCGLVVMKVIAERKAERLLAGN